MNFNNYLRFSILILTYFNNQKSNLIIYHELEAVGVAYSIQQCYETFFNASNIEIDPEDPHEEQFTLNLNDYLIYSSLIKLGYIVRRTPTNRHSKLTKTKQECEIKVFPGFTTNQSIINQLEYGQQDVKHILKQLDDVIPNITLTDLRKRVQIKSDQIRSNFRLLFDVYLPDKTFKKSQPGEPIYQVFTALNSDLVWPNLNDLIRNESIYSTVKYLYTFVDNGDVMFYSFKGNDQLPNVAAN